MVQVLRGSVGGAIAVVLTLTACGDDATKAGNGPPGVAISCHTAYRADVTMPIEEERDVVLEVNEPAIHEYGTLVWNAHHSVDPGEGAALDVRVETVEGDVVSAQLFQFSDELRNQFEAADHGFTGLNYAYDRSGAELQYYCVAQQ